MCPQPWFQGLPALILSQVWGFSPGLEQLLDAGLSLEAEISSVGSAQGMPRSLQSPGASQQGTAEVSWPESWDRAENILKTGLDRGGMDSFILLFLGLCHFLPLGVALVSLCRGGLSQGGDMGTSPMDEGRGMQECHKSGGDRSPARARGHHILPLGL